MKSLRTSLIIAYCMTVFGCAQLNPGDNAAAAGIDAAERQLLVMLRAPPPHFRPGIDYASGYDVRVRQNGQRRIAEELALQHDLVLVTDWPMPALGVDCFVLEAPNHQAIERLVDEIARDKRVESVQAMSVFHVLAHNDPLYPLQPAAQLWHLAEVHKITTGRDVRVAEVDTGVEADHPDLRGRIAVSRDFVGDPVPNGEAHGTSVAGIIAARADDGIGIAGVAPDARLYALRACWQQRGQSTASCTSFTLAKALQFALDQQVRVINLSLGGPRDRLLERLLDVGLARHIVIVSAADSQIVDGGFPAAHPGVLAIAAEGAVHVPKGALVAPGQDIPATTLDHSWGFVSGSSYAAAQVSGAAALLLERAPTLDAPQVKDALTSGDVSRAGIDQAMSVDICPAIARMMRTCVCSCVMAARDSSPIPTH